MTHFHPNIDPGAMSNMEHLEEMAEQGAVINDLLSPGIHTTIEFQGAQGRILLENTGTPKEKGFNVVESDDSNLKAGQNVVLDGSTVGGNLTKPGMLLPNSRLAFRARIDHEITIGEKDEDNVLTQQTYDFFISKGLAHQKEDGTLIFSYYDTRPTATDFIAHAKATFAGEEGVESRELF